MWPRRRRYSDDHSRFLKPIPTPKPPPGQPDFAPRPPSGGSGGSDAATSRRDWGFCEYCGHPEPHAMCPPPKEEPEMPSAGSASVDINIRVQTRLPWAYRHVQCGALFEVLHLDAPHSEPGAPSWEDAGLRRMTECPACGDNIPLIALRRYLLVEVEE